jgi:hypothetical protein
MIIIRRKHGCIRIGPFMLEWYAYGRQIALRFGNVAFVLERILCASHLV